MRKSILYLAAFLACYFHVHAQFYCTPGPTQIFDTEIVSVQLTGFSYNINRTSTACGPQGLQDFTALDSANVAVDSSYTLQVAFGSCGVAYPSSGQVWIDWDRNGTFDSTETVSTWNGLSLASGVTSPNSIVNFTVPSTAVLGRTRMRVMQTLGGSIPLDPCSTSIVWGAVEDYTIRIQPAGVCVNPPVVGKAVSNYSRVCINDSIRVGIDSLSSAYHPNQSYQWQSSKDSITWTNIIGANQFKLKTAVDSTKWYRLQVTCGNTVSSIPTKVTVVNTALAGGTYTINSSLPTAGNNFASFGDFIKSASCSGITGPITINVVPNATGYNQQIIIENIQGASATNTITINGNGARLHYNGGPNRGTLILNGAHDIKFKNLEVVGTNTANCYALELRNNAHHIEFDSCVFTVPKVNSSSQVYAIVASNYPQAPWQKGLAASHLLISNSIIEGGDKAVLFNGGTSSSTLGVNNRFTNNIVRNFNYLGIEINGQDSCQINHNDINRIGWNDPAAFRGIQLSYLMFNSEVIGNKIHHARDSIQIGSSAATGIAVYITNATNSGLIVANNAIYDICMNGNTDGIYLYSGNNVDVLHNTIRLERTGSQISLVNMHALYAYASSGTFNIQNNIFQLSYNSIGFVYGIYLKNANSGFNINHNQYHITGTVPNTAYTGRWLNNDFATLSNWQTANIGAFDQQSVEGDPNFAADKISPQSPVGNANGSNLLAKVPVDIYGNSRTTTPDIGAVEFNLPSCAPPSYINTTVFSGGVRLEWTNSPGVDSVTVEYDTCGFTLGLGTKKTVTGNSFTATGLLGNACYTFYFHSWCNGSAGTVLSNINTNTQCGQVTLPNNQGFNTSGGSTTLAIPPTCWTHISTSSSPQVYAYGLNTNQPNSPTTHWRMFNGANTTDTLALVSRAIQGINNGNVQASFWAKSNSINPVRMYVGTMPSPLDTNAISIIDTFWVSQNYTQYKSYFLPELGYNGTDKYVVFMLGNTAVGQNLFLDDIFFSVLPNCHLPLRVALNSRTPNSITLKWTTTTGTCFNVEYGPTGFTKGNGTTLTNVTSPLTISTLAPNTGYDVYVADCCSPNSWTDPITVFTACNGPLNGVYTINKNMPTSALNFNSFGELSRTLNNCGINGPVVVNVASNSGPYLEQIILGDIYGANDTNTITINGNGNLLTFGANSQQQPATLTLSEAHHFIIKNLEIEGTTTGYCHAVQMRNGSSFNALEGCFIFVNKSSSALGPRALVISDDALGYNKPSSAMNYNTVANCILEGGYYCVVVSGPDVGTPSKGNSFENNEIRNFKQFGLFVRGQEDMHIVGNDIHREQRDAQAPFYGISLTSILNNVNIVGNRFHHMAPPGINLNYTVALIHAENVQGDSAKPILIANNLTYNINASNSIGMRYSGTGTTYHIYHNTIVLNGFTGSQNNAHRALDIQSTSGAFHIKNNIFSCKQAGSGQKHLIYINDTTPQFYIDYNQYLMAAGGPASSNHIGYWGGNKTSLSDWQSANGNTFEGNGLVGSVQFVDIIKGSLTPYQAIGSNNATNLNTFVPTDYYKATRSNTPDRGAIEFNTVTNDVELASATLKHGGLCLSPVDTVIIEVKNVFGDTIGFANSPLSVHWEVSGPKNSSGTITINTNTLLPQANLQVQANTVDLSEPGLYSLKAYIDSNAINQYQQNDTSEFYETEIISLFKAQQTVDTVFSGTDTAILDVHSILLNQGQFFISEICQYKTTTGEPASGWPTWLGADDYIEITGTPYADLGGYTLEQWQSTMDGSYTFPPGTILSSNGTAIIAVGEMGSSVPSPSNHYYHGNGSFTGDYFSSLISGRILKDPTGNIVDAVAYGSYTFPVAAGVSAQDWSGFTPSASGTCGIRLIGPDVNNSSNWAVVSSSVLQDPNSLNSNVPMPSASSTPGFTWNYNGSVIDTNVRISVGPWPNPGVYKYVASLSNSACGPFYDTATIYAIFNVDCLAASSASVSNIGCDSATVQWISPANSIGATIEFGAKGFVPGSGIVAGMVNSPYILSGLIPNTQYDVYLYDSCATGSSNPLKIELLTQNGPQPTINLNASISAINLIQASVQFSSGSNTSNVHWDFGDGQSGVGINPIHNYTSNGTYTVIATATNTCGMLTDTIVVVIEGISIDENHWVKSLVIFPNPNKGEFNIELLSEKSKELTLKVISPIGQVIYEHHEKDLSGAFRHHVDLKNIASGIYSIQISSNKGVLTQKIIIRH